MDSKALDLNVAWERDKRQLDILNPFQTIKIMLTKIALFNTKNHAQAILTLNKSSIQLVGENQIGKTTLIDTLNFLYVIKPQSMFFDNGKYNFVQTIEHLFPTEQHSFIIFESYKRDHGYLCIVVKRKLNDIEYYKINAPFDKLPIKTGNKINSFNEIREKLMISSGLFEQIDRLKLFKIVYSNDLTKNAIVWINHSVNRKGQSLENSFTQVYRFLINSKLINAETLKEALIIANDRKNTILKVFADKSEKENIVRFKELQKDIERFFGIKPLYEDFKSTVEKYNIKKDLVGNLYYTFRNYYDNETLKLEKEISASKVKIQNIENELYDENNGLETLKTKLSTELGSLKERINQKNKEIAHLNSILSEIALLNPLNMPFEQLISEFENNQNSLEEKLKKINHYLYDIEKQGQNLNEKQIEQKIARLKTYKQKLNHQLASWHDLLKFNILKDGEQQTLISNLLSDQILNLHKKSIIKPIENLEKDLMTVFDGIIDVSSIEIKPIETIEEIKAQFIEIAEEIKEYQTKLEFVKNYNSKKKECDILNAKIVNIKDNIEKIKRKAPTEQAIEALSHGVKNLAFEFKEKNTELTQIEKQIPAKRKAQTDLSHLITENENVIKMLNVYKEEFANVEIMPLKGEIQDFMDLNALIKQLRKEDKELSELRKNKFQKFNDLKFKLNRNNYSDEHEFLKVIGSEIEGLPLREKSKEELLRNISERIIDPVFQYLKAYQEFKEDFIKAFNRKIAKYSISKIQELKVILNDNILFIKELESITKVRKLNIGQSLPIFDMNDKEQQLGLEKLDEYLNTVKSRMYEFSDLFGISIKKTNQDGSQQEINLQKQNESTGTIRMINLIVFLLIIKYFKADKFDNRVVFFVDELSIDQSNISELIDFCKENGFIAIFAANQPGVGIEKYYFMKRSAENNFKVVLDERHTGQIHKKNE